MFSSNADLSLGLGAGFDLFIKHFLLTVSANYNFNTKKRACPKNASVTIDEEQKKISFKFSDTDLNDYKIFYANRYCTYYDLSGNFAHQIGIEYNVENKPDELLKGIVDISEISRSINHFSAVEFRDDSVDKSLYSCPFSSKISGNKVIFGSKYYEGYLINEKKNESDSNSYSCFKSVTKSDCEKKNDSFACMWISNDNEYGGYCNVDKLQYVKCGDAFDIPAEAPKIMSFAINLLKIATPIILILTGIVTLVKAVAASKDDEIKKAQTILIKKAIAAAFVFFVISIVQFVILKVADSSELGSIRSCMSCVLNNDCDKSVYFKTKVGDEYVCHSVSNPDQAVTCGENE